MKILIKGGRVIDPESGVNAVLDLLVDEGKVARLGSGLSEDGAQPYDATGCLVLPGLVDLHAHLREPGEEYKEDIASGTAAAAAGGFTSLAVMPNTRPVVDNSSLVRSVLERVAQNGLVNVFPIGAISKGQKGEELTEMGDMKEAGIVAVSDDGKPVQSSELMRLALIYANQFGLPVFSHCEDLSLVNEGVMNYGYTSNRLGLRGIPAAAEEVQVARDLILAEATGAHLHLCHISTAGSVELVRRAKERAMAGGFRVTCEVTPHHLTLTDEAVANSQYDTDTKVNPPLRTEADLVALREALADGTIDAIATDHAPHHQDDKLVEYNYAAFGISGLETALAVIHDRLVRNGILDWLTLVQRMSLTPARIIGIDRGRLSQGAVADITIFDPALRWTVDSRQFRSKGRNTPFEGQELVGRVRTTFVSGRLVYSAG
ncbi:MAG: dihydroorotase [Bacillota bacterium]